MTQEQAIGIALIVAAVVFVIAIIVGFVTKNRSWRSRFREQAEADGCVTTGQCYQTRKSFRIEERHGDHSYHYTLTVRYKYTVDGVAYRTKVKYRYHDMSRNAHLDYPNQIQVYYDKANPKKAYAESELSPAAAQAEGVMLIWFVTFAAGMAAYLVLHMIFRL